MKGKPRVVPKLDEGGLRNLNENFDEVWRNAQDVGLEIQNSAPAANDLREGQAVAGTGGKLWVRIGGDVYEFVGVKV